MTKQIFFVGSIVIIAVVLVAALVGTVGGLGTPAPIPPVVASGPEDADETFYVVAFHWDWAAFTEDGTLIDQIRVDNGTTIKIFAVNLHAMTAIMKLPTPVSDAIMAFDASREGGHDMDAMDDMAGMEGMDDAEELLWPYMNDHGFLIHYYGVIEYLAEDATEPVRVVFTADRPGEYNFTCTNFCGLLNGDDDHDDANGDANGDDDHDDANGDDDHDDANGDDQDGEGHITMPRIMLIVT